MVKSSEKDFIIELLPVTIIFTNGPHRLFLKPMGKSLNQYIVLDILIPKATHTLRPALAPRLTTTKKLFQQFLPLAALRKTPIPSQKSI